MSKEVKHFNEHRASVRVSELEKEAKTLGEIIKLLREVTGDKEVKTIGAFNDWLTAQTNFKSPSFSAESMDLGDAYRQIRYLTDLVTTITVEDLTPMYKLKPSVIEKIQSEFKTYYTKEELEIRASFQKIQSEWEALPRAIRVNSLINRDGLIKSGHLTVK